MQIATAGIGSKNTPDKPTVPVYEPLVEEAYKYNSEAITNWIYSQDDPSSAEARIQAAQLLSQRTDIDIQTAFKKFDTIAEAWTGGKTTDLNAFQAIKRSYEIGDYTDELGALYYRRLMGDDSETLALKIENMEAEMPAADEAKRAFPVDFLKAAAEMVPIMIGGLEAGAQRGLLYGGGAAATALIAGQAGPQVGLPEEAITVPGAFLTLFGVGMKSGSIEHISQVEAGLIYKDIVDSGVEPELARNIALPAGLLNGAIEMLQIGNIPGIDSIVRKATFSSAKRIARELKNKGLTGAAKRAAGRAAVRTGVGMVGNVAEETGQELVQESVSIIAEEMGKALSENGVSPSNAEDIVSRLTETMMQSVKAFTVMGLPGNVAKIGSNVRNYANAQRIEKRFNELNPEDTAAIEAAIQEEVARDRTVNVTEGGKISGEGGDTAGNIKYTIEDNKLKIDNIELKEGYDYPEVAAQVVDKIIQENPGVEIDYSEIEDTTGTARRAVEDQYPTLQRYNRRLDTVRRVVEKVQTEQAKLLKQIVKEYGSIEAMDTQIEAWNKEADQLAAQYENETNEEVTAELEVRLNAVEQKLNKAEELDTSFRGTEEALAISQTKLERAEAAKKAFNPLDNKEDYQKSSQEYTEEKQARSTQRFSGAAEGESLKLKLLDVFPKFTEKEADLAITLIDARAEAEGLTTAEYVEKTFTPEILQKGLTEEQYAQAEVQGVAPKAAIRFLEDGRAIIQTTEISDFSSFVHEFGHILRRQLGDKQLRILEKEYGIKKGEWTTSAEERFAVEFEEYVRKGEAPNSKLREAFQKMAQILSAIYRGLRGELQLSPEVTSVMDSIFDSNRINALTKIETTEDLMLFQTAWHGSPQEHTLFQSVDFTAAELDEVIEYAKTLESKGQEIIAKNKNSTKLIAEVRVRSERERAGKRIALAKALADGVQKFTNDRKESIAVVHNSSRPEARFQVSYFDERGAYSHSSVNSAKEVFDVLWDRRILNPQIERQQLGDILFQALQSEEESGIITDEELKEIGVAYGSKEEYEKAFRSALSNFRPARRETGPLGPNRIKEGYSRIPAEILPKRINIVGKTIRNASDAAALFSLFRNPRVEIFNIVYTSETGEVLGHHAITSGVPGITKAILGETHEEAFGKVRKTMESLGATQLWIAHNHPSGSVGASEADINITNAYGYNFQPGFAGHIIVDHDIYNFIDAEGEHVREAPIPRREYQSSALKKSESITSPDGVAVAIKKVLSDETPTAMIFLNNAHKIVSWNYADFSNGKPEKILENTRKLLRTVGASKVIIGTIEDSVYEKMSSIIRGANGTRNDVIIDVFVTNEDGTLKRDLIADGYYTGADWQRHEYKALDSRGYKDYLINYSDPRTLFQGAQYVPGFEVDYDSFYEVYEGDTADVDALAIHNTRAVIKQMLWDNGRLNDDVVYEMRTDNYEKWEISDRLEDVTNKYVEEIYDEQRLYAEDGVVENFEPLADIHEIAMVAKGTTEFIELAGYVLPDGTMLDFSDGQGERIEDHRQLNLPIKGDLSGTELMIAFQKTGAVRIDANSGLFDAETPPTYQQLNVINDIVDAAGYVQVEVAQNSRRASFDTENAEKAKGVIRRFYSGEDIQEGTLFQDDHREQVRKALDEGLYVPDEVLAEYADEQWAADELRKRSDKDQQMDELTWLQDEARKQKNPDEFVKYIEFMYPEEGMDVEWLRDFWYKSQPADMAANNKAFREEWANEEGVKRIILAMQEWKAMGEDATYLGFSGTFVAAMHSGREPQGTELQKMVATLKNPSNTETYRAAVAQLLKDRSAYEMFERDLEAKLLEEKDNPVEIPPEKTLKDVADQFNSKLRNKILSGKVTKEDLDAQFAEDRKVMRESWKKLQELEAQKKELQQEYETLRRQAGKQDVKQKTEIKELRKKLTSLEKAIAREKRYRAERKKAASERKKANDYMMKLAKAITRKVPGTVNFVQREQIEAIQAMVDPKFRMQKTIDKRKRVIEELEKDPTFSMAVNDTFLRDLNKKAIWKETAGGKVEFDSEMYFTLAELEDLHNAVELLTIEGKAEFEKRKKAADQEVKRTVAASIEIMLNGKIFEVDWNPVLEDKATGKDKAQSVFLSTIRPSRIADMIDGGKDFKGPIHQLYIDEVNNAYAEEIRNRFEREERVNQLMKRYGLKPSDFGKTFEAFGLKPTLDQVLKMYANTLNDRNHAAQMWGHKIADFHVNQFMSEVNKVYPQARDFADALLGDYDENFSRLDEAHSMMTNSRLPKEVNYSPLSRKDDGYSWHAENLADEISQEYGIARGRIAKGFTKARVNITPQHQRKMDFQGLYSEWLGQIEKQEHYIAMSTPVRKMRRVLDDSTFREVVKDKRGRAFLSELDHYISRVANPRVMWSHDQMSRILRLAKKNYAIYALSGNLMTALKQVPSLMYYLPETDPGSVLAALGQTAAKWEETRNFIEAKDPAMRDRSVERDIAALRKSKDKGVQNIINKVGEAGMQPILIMDKIAVTAGWMAVYNNRIQKGFSEAEAVQEARNVTQRTQPASKPHEIASLYTKESWSVFTMFSNQLNQIWNIALYDAPAAIKSRHALKGFAYYGSIALANAFIWSVTNRQLPEEPEEFAEAFTTGFINMIPILGTQITQMASDWRNADIFIFEPLKDIMSGVDYASEKKAGKAMEQWLDAAMKIFRAPGVEVRRIKKGIQSGSAGKAAQYIILGGEWNGSK